MSARVLAPPTQGCAPKLAMSARSATCRSVTPFAAASDQDRDPRLLDGQRQQLRPGDLVMTAAIGDRVAARPQAVHDVERFVERGLPVAQPRERQPDLSELVGVV